MNSEKNREFAMWKKVAIEVHSLCNRDCAFCQRYYDRSGIRKDKDANPIKKEMPAEKVYGIIDQLTALGFKGTVLFHGMSEPLLHPGIVDFIKYAKDKGLRVRITTNGDMLKKDEQLCAKLDGMVDEFKVSLYDYTTYKEKMQDIRYWRNKISKSKLKFDCPREFPVLRHNSALYPSEKKNNKILDYPCFRARNLLIRYDGELSLCCYDDYCAFGLGNVFEQKIEDIWWSDKHIKIAVALQKPGGRKMFDFCKTCYVLPVKRRSLMTKIYRKVYLSLFRWGFIKINRDECLTYPVI